MVQLNEIKDNNGSTRPRKRIGRGIGSGMGKTCCKGHKGQKARCGVSIDGFEGGQMPIYRRLPKRGFNNYNFTKDFYLINLGSVQSAIDAGKINTAQEIDEILLKDIGLAGHSKNGVRLLANGRIISKVNFKVTAASKAAISAIEKIGGSIDIDLAKKARSMSK
ncbi:Ribosomal protein L15 [Candidatus Endolissoclinum faulkneri L5]|uniref:Large ribosomal subunit protein uL15 n=1 Tax=Candidatus Endolissoclinum faulkneri L5 TaxID=1401328 RepID=V9TS14_9PROT|nr:50S ribosomal protein L15 [Candidatus Endolissoclinum faulkneri]AHC73366.1 Ribosomal protein L15 [Candidatus Endolissoclinum faulkneri L5]